MPAYDPDNIFAKIIAGQINVRDGMEQAARECDQIVADAMR